jgi:hypothetical protein
VPATVDKGGLCDGIDALAHRSLGLVECFITRSDPVNGKYLKPPVLPQM